MCEVKAEEVSLQEFLLSLCRYIVVRLLTVRCPSVTDFFALLACCSRGHPPSGATTLSRTTTYDGPTSLPGVQPDVKRTIQAEGSLENVPGSSSSSTGAVPLPSSSLKVG